MVLFDGEILLHHRRVANGFLGAAHADLMYKWLAALSLRNALSALSAILRGNMSV
jgi:hypothetical protein